jgi:hypothetical protein
MNHTARTLRQALLVWALLDAALLATGAAAPAAQAARCPHASLLLVLAAGLLLEAAAAGTDHLDGLMRVQRTAAEAARPVEVRARGTGLREVVLLRKEGAGDGAELHRALSGKCAPTPQSAAGCTGCSAGLAADQCTAWGQFFDGAGGPNWKYFGKGCSKDDPCACCPQKNLAGECGVTCSGGSITSM